MQLPVARPARLLLTLLATFSLSACADVLDPPAAVVDGDPITAQELRSDVRALEVVLELQGQSCGTPVGPEHQESACARAVLSNLIAERLTEPAARELDVTVRASEVGAQFEGFIEQIGRNEVEAELARDGLDLDDLRGLFERFVLSEEVRRAIAADVVGEETLRAEYEGRRGQFVRTYHPAHILLRTRAQAERTASRATPENFAELAEELSQDRGSAARGGDLGPVTPGQFVPEFEAAAVRLEPGEISEPVQSQFGWHVILLIEIDVAPFEEVRDSLLDEVAAPAFRDWFTARLAEVEVEVDPRFGSFDPATGQVLPRRTTADEPAPSAS